MEMLNKKQLSIFCNIMGIEKLFGFNLGANDAYETKIKNFSELVNDGFIVERNLSDEATKILNLLSEYQQSEKFFKLNEAMFAQCVSDRECFVIIKECQNDTIFVDLIDLENLILIFIDKNRGLFKICEKSVLSEIVLETEVFNELSTLKEDCNITKFTIYDINKKVISETITYINDGYFKMYDLSINKMDLVGKKDAVDRIIQLIEKSGNDCNELS